MGCAQQQAFKAIIQQDNTLSISVVNAAVIDLVNEPKLEPDRRYSTISRVSLGTQDISQVARQKTNLSMLDLNASLSEPIQLSPNLSVGSVQPSQPCLVMSPLAFNGRSSISMHNE